ncbi:hypothetical protein [Verrucomicrobium spinosum]|nr:hypothetical protein [Verrucomicrobium spinosum]
MNEEERETLAAELMGQVRARLAGVPADEERDVLDAWLPWLKSA